MEQVLGYTLGQAGHRRPEATEQSWLVVANTWRQRYTQRRALLQLDDRLLADVGLTRAEAETEARKPFWAA